MYLVVGLLIELIALTWFKTLLIVFQDQHYLKRSLERVSTGPNSNTNTRQSFDFRDPETVRQLVSQ